MICFNGHSFHSEIAWSLAFWNKQFKTFDSQIWDLAGPRIWEFCRGFPTYLIQEVKNIDQNDVDPDDNDIIKSRLRRSTRHYFVGRLRGQTQSQYMNFGNSSSNGKAEAESEYGVSKATVGMIFFNVFMKTKTRLYLRHYYWRSLIFKWAPTGWVKHKVKVVH